MEEIEGSNLMKVEFKTNKYLNGSGFEAKVFTGKIYLLVQYFFLVVDANFKNIFFYNFRVRRYINRPIWCDRIR